jgi:hypothetical protein
MLSWLLCPRNFPVLLQELLNGIDRLSRSTWQVNSHLPLEEEQGYNLYQCTIGQQSCNGTFRENTWDW